MTQTASKRLQTIIEHYLEDPYYEDRDLVRKRQLTLPDLQSIIGRFIQNELSFVEFRDLLSKTLRPANTWSAQGRFMMEINKFIKNHCDSSEEAAQTFRSILRGLNTQNVGVRIEAFYNFLLKERERLHREGKPSGAVVAPGNSAYMISLFATWLDPNIDSMVFSEGVRKELANFIHDGLLEPAPELRTSNVAVEITTNSDYQAIKTTLQALDPRVKNSPYWCEFFFYWVRDHRESLDLIIKDTNNIDILAQEPTRIAKVAEIPGQYASLTTSTIDSSLLIENISLQPTPEPLLTYLIHKIQQSILIDEATIRRIYHALLAGHVILTGPPGTGKTDLARLIPETLWSSLKADNDSFEQDNEEPFPDLTTETAYTTLLFTATDDWNPRTIIGGIVPSITDSQTMYKIQYGHLTSTIFKNWAIQGQNPAEWDIQTIRRTRITTPDSLRRGISNTFRGQWLVIDEFNRAPIDLALGDALTSLGGHNFLRVPTNNSSAELPIPQDFRIIGTLNSFDRNYLNQLSEALKRRFSFIEILPPIRQQRFAEQGIVLVKALKSISHLSNDIINDETGFTLWSDIVQVDPSPQTLYTISWMGENDPFEHVFTYAWQLFEVIRIYRQLGTAQAITLFRHMLIEGILGNYATPDRWFTALDSALCTTIADQLQVLLPDEIDALLLYLTTDRTAFSTAYIRLLSTLAPTRLYAQLIALSNVTDELGHQLLTDEQVEDLARTNTPDVPSRILPQLFHLSSTEYTPYKLPQFTRRLRTFKIERGL